MRFNAQIFLIDFDLAGYKNKLDEELTEITKDAARSWLKTVLRIIPTWSRASRATFEALAREVGFTITYGPLVASKDRFQLGISTSKGGLEITPLKSYHFFYETNLRYLAYNEANAAIAGDPPKPFGRLINPTPYNFIEAGDSDFMSFSQEVLLPNPFKFITGKRI